MFALSLSALVLFLLGCIAYIVWIVRAAIKGQWRKFWILLSISIVTVGWPMFPRAYFYSEEQAKAVATATFIRVCTKANVDPAIYDPPTPTTVGGTVWAFEWRVKPGNLTPKNVSPMVGVWIGYSGWTEVYLGGKD